MRVSDSHEGKFGKKDDNSRWNVEDCKNILTDWGFFEFYKELFVLAKRFNTDISTETEERIFFDDVMQWNP